MAEQVTFTPLETVSKVEISVRCKNLKDLDVFSKSDPIVFLYERLSPSAVWNKLGKTEVIDNNLNPEFSKTFLLDYRFEEVQYLRFSVYDVDNKHHVDNISLHDFIGESFCTLADIVTAGQEYNKTLRSNGTSRGQIYVTAEEIQDSKFTIQFQFSASNLDKKDFFGKSDPLLEIAKSQEGGGYSLVYRSQPLMKTLNPRWPGFELTIQKLCSGDWDRTLKLSVWDWNRSGSHDFIGSAFTTLREICPEKGGQVFNLELINQEKKKKKKYKSSGVLNLEMVKGIPTHTFVDYIRGGCQISLMVAIDFTASNGKPQEPSSLHYIGQSQMLNQTRDNEYMQAIRSVGSILAPYDSDQLIPVFGFGARLPPNGEVSHCFPLNFNPQGPDVFGVEGILEAYHYALRQVQLFGPTNFSYFLDKAMEYASGSSMAQAQQNYTILLVITDGVISDMTRTVDKIVAASRLPLSIVIVGVGGADFTNMEVLDADDTPLVNQRGVKMSRDIVQFVPLRQFQSRGGANFSLAKETLAEIPTQLLSFMKSKGIKPNPPPLRRQETFSQRIPAPLQSAVPALQQTYTQQLVPTPSQAPQGIHQYYPPEQQLQQPYPQNYLRTQGPPPSYTSLGTPSVQPYP